jgi:putative signal transducing protein
MSSKSDDLVVVGTFNNRQEAELAKGALDAAGIEALVRSDDAGGLRPAMSFSNGVELIVRGEDADEARRILNV